MEKEKEGQNVVWKRGVNIKDGVQRGGTGRNRNTMRKEDKETRGKTGKEQSRKKNDKEKQETR